MNKKTIIISVTVIGLAVIIALGATIWMITSWMIGGLPEHAGTCNDGYTLWVRNPGAGFRYRFELHDEEGRVVEKGITSKTLNPYLDEHDCHNLSSKIFGG